MSNVQKELAIFGKFGFEIPPVGVKYLATKPEGLEKLDQIFDFCEMLAESQQGKAFYVASDNFTCVGPLLLGMVAEDPIFESGQVGPKLEAFRDVRANRRIYQHIPRLKQNVINYVLFAPLAEMLFEPDVLVITATVSQAEIILRARGYSTGEPWSARGTTVAGCSWLYLYPYLSGEMNFTVTGFGFGMRARRLFPEGMVLISIPWDLLPGIIGNLQDMNWIPHSYTIGREAHKKKVRGILEELRQGT